jgi:hypothetical protein
MNKSLFRVNSYTERWSDSSRFYGWPWGRGILVLQVILGEKKEHKEGQERSWKKFAFEVLPTSFRLQSSVCTEPYLMYHASKPPMMYLLVCYIKGIFGSTGVELQYLARQVVYYLSHASSPFCFIFRIASLLIPRLAWTVILLLMCPLIAGMTGGPWELFCMGWPQIMILLISAS